MEQQTTQQGTDHQEMGHQEMGHSILNEIQEDMVVYDLNNEKVGRVKTVHLGETSEEMEQTGKGPATTPATSLPKEEVDLIPFAFRGAVSSSNPEEEEVIRNRLLQEGFIHIDAAGLFKSDRYALRDQIAAVSGDRVLLSVPKEELFKV